MRKGLTFVEMLAVIVIVAILMVVTSLGYSKYIAAGETAKCQELVRNTATALTAIFNKQGFWPTALRSGTGGEDALLDENRAYAIAHFGYMTLAKENGKLSGYDRFGIVTPWAAAVVKRRGDKAKLSDRVPSGGTIKDHILHYAVDLDGDGVIRNAVIGGQKVTLRAIVAVWCCGRDGKIDAWASDGKSDDVYSFSVAEVKDDE